MAIPASLRLLHVLEILDMKHISQEFLSISGRENGTLVRETSCFVPALREKNCYIISKRTQNLPFRVTLELEEQKFERGGEVLFLQKRWTKNANLLKPPGGFWFWFSPVRGRQ